MRRSSKTSLSPKMVRTLAFAWIGLVVGAGILTFVVLLVTLNNRAERISAQTTPTLSPPVPTQIPLPTPVQVPTSSSTPAAGTPGVPTPATVGLDSSMALGGQVPGFISNEDVMRSAGMTWVKYQIKWNPSLDPELAEALVTGGHERGFKVLLSISGDPYPQQTIDYAGYIAYLSEVAALQPDAIEVWNEMNLDREWPRGQVDPASYVANMLAPAYNAIKSVSPNTAVIIGALAPTGVNDGNNIWSDDRYVAGLAAAGAASYADCIGVHHNSGTTSPSVRSGRPEGDHYSWYFLPTIEVYYNGMNGALPVCITEFGYLTPEGIGQPLPANFAWGANTTVAQQAAWLAEGVTIARNLGYVRLVIIWNVDFTNWGENDPYAGFAILRPDGTCPACAPLKAAIGG